MKKVLGKILLLALAAVFAVGGCAAQAPSGGGTPAPAKITAGTPGEKTFARFETSQGNFTIQLFTERAPQTTKNFIQLAQKGFYDGVIFHRVIDGFMIQGGDPTGTGTGGPGYTIKDEFHPDLKHDDAGILSMANAGPNTGGSQFFITLDKTPWLDGKHAVFGKVVEGMDTVRAIGKVKTGANDRPTVPVVIKKVTIEEKK